MPEPPRRWITRFEDLHVPDTYNEHFNVEKTVIFGYFVNRKYNSTALFKNWLDNVTEHYFIDTDRVFYIYTDNTELLKFKAQNIFINVIDGNFSDINKNRLSKLKFFNILF